MPDEEPTEPTQPEPATGDDLAAEVEKWKKLARQNEAQAKANAEAAKRLAELEDRDKSEAQRLTEQQKAAEERAAKAERELLRLRVAARKGLTEAQAKRLSGDSEEELEADAEDLLASFAPPEKDDTPSPSDRRAPKERLRPGAAPDAEPEESDPSKLADAVSKAKYGY